MCQVNSQMANYRNSATYSYKQQRISNKHEGSKQKTLKQLIIGTCCNELLFVMTSQPHSDLDRLIVKFPWSHSDTPQSVGLLWRSDRRVAETSTWQHTTFTTIHAPGGIRTHNLSKRAAADLRLRPRGHWDRRSTYLLLINSVDTKLIFAVNGWCNVWRNAFGKYAYYIFLLSCLAYCKLYQK